MRKESVTINANNAACTAFLLAHIATLLETHGDVRVIRVSKSPSGPGAAAFNLGQFMQEAIKAKQEGKF